MHHRVVCGYWDEKTQAEFGNQKFNIITSQNAFAHIPDPLSYLKLVRESLTDDGLMFISTSQSDMILNGEFDTIYHEHISFYNIESMRRLVERAGLFLVDVVKTPIHGTSYVFIIGKNNTNPQRIENLLAMENAQGLHEEFTYVDWANYVGELLFTIGETINEYRDNGYTIVGYGAAAKGMTLITAGRLLIDAIIDDNELKQGKWCPGINIPIVSSEYIKQRSTVGTVDRILFIPLAWNFYDEITRKIKTIRNDPNDRFMRYFPRVEIL
jgi:hypothetical protein